MDDLFINTYKKRPLVIEKARGSFVFDSKGKKYLDFLSGISVNNLGYSNKNILRAVSKQLKKIIHPSNYYFTQPQIDLARKLIDNTKLDRVFFANSGTEANEAAILFLSKYQKKVIDRDEVIVFGESFLGRTYGSRTMANGGCIDNIKVVRCKFNDVDSFRKTLSSKTLAIHLELVLGHGGIKKFDFALVQEIQAICKKENILIFVDEVQTGLGRVSGMFAFQEFNIQPDIITLGKSLGGGLPLSAVIASNRLAEAIEPGDYGCTMGGNSPACAAGIEVIKYLEKDIFIKSIQDKSCYISNELTKLQNKHSQIKDVRCYGMMCGLEIDVEVISGLVNKAIGMGLLMDVVNKNTLRLLPPLTVSYKEIDTAVKIIDEILSL